MSVNQKSIHSPKDGELSQFEGLRSTILRSKDMSTPCLVVLLTTALRPGLSVNELAEALELPQQTASRYAAILLGRYEDQMTSAVKTPFISQTINDEDPRKRSLSLTKAGLDYLRYVIGHKDKASKGGKD